MKRDLQKLINELIEYFEKHGIQDKDEKIIRENSCNKACNEYGIICSRNIYLHVEPCANYEVYDDVKEELNSLFKKKPEKETLFDLVEMHMREKGLKPSQVYKKAQITKQDFSRYVKPDSEGISRAMVFKLAIGLKLDCDETKRLLKSVGYGYNNKDKFDLIIMFCIDREIYDISLINLLLYDFKQPVLKTTNYKEY